MATIYKDYSINQLHALFSTATWGTLNPDQRLDACQEVENRYAAENNTAPCTITHKPMEGSTYGWQNGSTICLNSYLLKDGQFCVHYEDQDGVMQESRVDVLAPGWNTLDTVYHEGTHGIQESTGRMPQTYVTPEKDYSLYRIQGIEKEAYAIGQSKTLDALSTYEKETGKLDENRNEYIASVRNDSFQSAVAEAAEKYNDPNIENTVNNVIHDRDSNIVRVNPTKSYEAVNDLFGPQTYHVTNTIDDGMDESFEASGKTVENTVDDGMDESIERGESASAGIGAIGESVDNSMDDGISM